MTYSTQGIYCSVQRLGPCGNHAIGSWRKSDPTPTRLIQSIQVDQLLTPTVGAFDAPELQLSGAEEGVMS